MTGRIIINTNHPLLLEIFSEPIPVLFYKEDGEMVAHALTVDILAYGSDVKEASKELQDMIKTHVTECMENRRPDLIWNNAPNERFLEYISERSASKAQWMGEVKSKPLSDVNRLHGLKSNPRSMNLALS